MTARTPPVLVGGGATGPAAALTLARNNVPVHVIKKEPQRRRGRRGAGVQSSTSYAFRRFMNMKGDRSNVDYMEPTATIPYYNPNLVGLRAVICEYLTPSS
ncbi:hypothetical protein EDD15DRAFT_2287449 [Pisolithus albus]|nr:hypothetical protein EDD15DRAFT_2287449 [Pisolithus albus]